MPEACSKPCQTSKMMRHIEKTSMVRTVYSGIFRHIQQHSAVSSHVQSHCGKLRHNEAYSGITEAY